MIVIAGVLVLAVVGLGVAVLSAVAARAADRAAMLLVLVAATGGMLAFVVVLASTMVFGFGGRPPADPHIGTITVSSMPRLVTGLALATILVVIACVLIRTGDWERPENDVLDD